MRKTLRFAVLILMLGVLGAGLMTAVASELAQGPPNTFPTAAAELGRVTRGQPYTTACNDPNNDKSCYLVENREFFWSYRLDSFPTTALGCASAGTNYAVQQTAAHVYNFQSTAGIVYDIRVSVDNTIVRYCSGPGAVGVPVAGTQATAYQACSSARTKASRIRSGEVVRVLGFVNFRTAAGLSSPIISRINAPNEFSVTGPVCAQDTVWWQVQFQGQSGFVAEADNATGAYLLEPTGIQSGGNVVSPIITWQSGAACTGPRFMPSRLVINGRGVVIAANGVNVRSEANAASGIVNDIAFGESFRVIGGPRCSASIVWYQVQQENNAAISGWVAEGDAGQYYLQPLY